MKKKVYHITAQYIFNENIKKTETIVARSKVKAIQKFTDYGCLWNVIECKEMNLDEKFRDS